MQDYPKASEAVGLSTFLFRWERTFVPQSGLQFVEGKI